MSVIFLNEFETDLGKFRTAATDQELICILIPSASQKSIKQTIAREFNAVEFSHGGTINELAQTQIIEYLQGQRQKYDLPLREFGTAFQKQALGLVAKIPYAKTRTYGELARDLNKPGAARAVGSANARNLIPIVIPCHRVLAVNGLGGYAGGLKMKKHLLQLEGAMFKSLSTN